MTNVALLRAQIGNPPPAAPTAGAISTPDDAQLRDSLAGYIRSLFEAAKQHRQRDGHDERMMKSLRAVRGEYDSTTINDIKNFGGSEVYARITASKVRGVAALLREIYTATDRPWELSPTPEPDLKGESLDVAVDEVLKAEVMEMAAAGQPPTPQIIEERRVKLREMLAEKRLKAATDALRARERSIDDILYEGGFYNAIWEFLLDIATFPFAVLKGPVVRYKQVLKWKGQKPTMQNVPTMQWERCSPFDVYFSPWAQTPQDGFIIHKQRTSRADLQSLIGLPSYDSEAIQRVLGMDGSAFNDWWSYTENERAALEQRESDTSAWTDSGDRPYPMLEFHGPVTGKRLREWGMKADTVPDETKDLQVIAYVIGREVIGVRLNPHPCGRKSFYVDSFERVPGSCYGHAVPDLISDIQDVANAALRALNNNLAIASGPMAWVNEDRLATNDANSTKMWPWKVFRTTDSANPNSSNEKPMEFFQPDANASTLLMVYEKFCQMADELSSLPRYMQGNAQSLGGAGRTASGLSMLIEASNRTIKQTVSSIDQNVIEPAVEDLNIYLALLKPELIMAGDISVRAKGAVELVQRETLRMRRIEFLNITNNATDSQIIGPVGRHAVLREVARDLGLPLAEVMAIPEDKLQMLLDMQFAQAAASFQQPPGGAQPGQQPEGGGPPQPAVQGVARPQANSPGA